jgi:hypothetical protein
VNAPDEPPSDHVPASDSGVALKSPADPDGAVLAASTTAVAGAAAIAGDDAAAAGTVTSAASWKSVTLSEESSGVCLRHDATPGVVSAQAGSSTRRSREA